MKRRFAILGPLEVELEGGRRAAVPQGRVLAFLGLLLVHRGTLVTPDRALDELWPEQPPRNGRNAVQVLASRLRSALGEGAVVSRRGGYVLPVAPADVDADRFEERYGLGTEQLARDAPWKAAETLREALSMWRGPALADIRDERFAQPEAARLDDLRLTCLSERVDADLACGRHAGLAGELEALVGEHPLRERLRAQRMLALYREGRQAEALAEYRDARLALVDGLGIEPSPELRALEAAILRHDVPPPQAARPGVALDARRSVTCLVARLARPEASAELDPESHRAVLDRFHEAASAACDRHGGSVTELRGDSIAGVFGIPVAHEDDAQRAVRAALDVRRHARDLPFGFGAHCGASTGEVVGAARVASAPVIGEPVAAAERLARRAGAGEIWIGASTWRLVRHAARADEAGGDAYVLRELDPAAPAIERRLHRPLVGRARELARLHGAFDRVATARAPELLTVAGEPGIGKSRLVAEVAAAAGGRRVLCARCPAYGEGLTYAPLREIVLQAAGDRTIDELAAGIGLAPATAHRVAAAVGIETGDAGDEIARAFRELIEALARERPLAIVIDDGHWAEPALLELLRDAVAQLRASPLLVVWVTRALPAEGDAVLELEPLSAEASAGLLAEIAGGRLEPADERRVAEAAGGNPLFLEQLTAFVGEDRAAGALPPAIQGLLAARLDRLGTAERAALALAAVAGDDVEADAIHALASGVTRADVEQACDRLVARHLLTRGDRGGLRFRHALIRDAAYASLAKSARARLHERHASWLADREHALADADARIGLHLELACRLAAEVEGAAPAELSGRAGRRLAAAATLAHARGDLPGQIGLLERAFALLGKDREEGVALLPGLVSAVYEHGDSRRAEHLAELAVSAGAALGLTAVEAVAAVDRERIRLTQRPETARVDESLRVAERSAATLRSRGDLAGLARAEYLMCDLAKLRGDLVGASAHAGEMLRHARACGSRLDAAAALAYMAWNFVEGPWPVHEAIAGCEALEREAGDLRAAALSAAGCRAALVAMTGAFRHSREAMARAREGLEELGWGEMAAYMALLDALAETLGGDPAAAERAVRDAHRIALEAGDRWFESTAYVDLARAILAQGRDGAAAVADIDSVPAPCDAEWVIKRHVARARLTSGEHDDDRAIAEARAAVAAAEPTTLAVFCADAHRAHADVLLAAGRREEAAAAVRRALELDEAKGNLAAATAARRRYGPLLSPPGPASPSARRAGSAARSR